MNSIMAGTINHKSHKYPAGTVGDWNFNKGVLNIVVSETGDWKMNALIMIHEIVESILCKANDIPETKVRKFDIEFDKKHSHGRGRETEPGDDPLSPYRRQHCVATGIERIIAAEMGVSWSEYEEKLEGLK